MYIIVDIYTGEVMGESFNYFGITEQLEDLTAMYPYEQFLIEMPDGSTVPAAEW